MALSDQIDLATAPPFRIGPLTVEPALRQVTAAASETLEPRVMQVLVQLAMANGGIVSRDELVRRCWEGRIVGDDVINRVIARLRRLLEQHGGGAVRIETITKVGYRLIGPVVLTGPSVRAPLATDVIDATIPQKLAPTSTAPSGNRRRWWLLASATVAVLALAATAWRAANPPPGPLHATLRVGEFKTLSADVPAALPAQLESELLLKFGEAPMTFATIVRTPPDDKEQAFVVAGSVVRTGDMLRYDFNLSEQASGKTPLSFRIERPFATDTTVGSVAVEASRIVTCTLTGLIKGRTQPLPDSTAMLYGRFCQAASLGLASRDARIALLRQAVGQTPDFAGGWLALASNLAGAMPEAEKRPGSSEYDEAIAALAMAERLGLDNSGSLNTRARLLPSRAIAGREALLRESARRFATESNGVAPFNLGNLLWNAGRMNDAIASNRTALQINPNHEEGTHFQASMLRWTGQIPESDAMIRKLDRDWPEAEHGRRFGVSDALQRGDYAAARTALAGLTPPSPRVAAAVNAALMALESGDAAARKAGGDRLVAMNTSKSTRTAIAFELLAALGRDADALNVAETLIYGPQVPSTKILFHPALARARALPAFAKLAGRLGLVDYWRQSGHLPDFCTAGDAPTLCAALKRRS